MPGSFITSARTTQCAQCRRDKKGCTFKLMLKPGSQVCDLCIKSGYICTGLIGKDDYNQLTVNQINELRRRVTRDPEDLIAELDCLWYLMSGLDAAGVSQSGGSKSMLQSIWHRRRESADASDTAKGKSKTQNPPSDLSTCRSINLAKKALRQAIGLTVDEAGPVILQLLAKNKFAEARALGSLCCGQIAYSESAIIQDYTTGIGLSSVMANRLDFDKATGLWFRWFKAITTPKVLDKIPASYAGQSLVEDKDIIFAFTTLKKVFYKCSIQLLGLLSRPEDIMKPQLSRLFESIDPIVTRAIVLDEAQPGILLNMLEAELSFNISQSTDHGYKNIFHYIAANKGGGDTESIAPTSLYPSLQLILTILRDSKREHFTEHIKKLLLQGTDSETGCKDLNPLHLAVIQGNDTTLTELIQLHHQVGVTRLYQEVMTSSILRPESLGQPLLKSGGEVVKRLRVSTFMLAILFQRATLFLGHPSMPISFGPGDDPEWIKYVSCDPVALLEKNQYDYLGPVHMAALTCQPLLLKRLLTSKIYLFSEKDHWGLFDILIFLRDLDVAKVMCVYLPLEKRIAKDVLNYIAIKLGRYHEIYSICENNFIERGLVEGVSKKRRIESPAAYIRDAPPKLVGMNPNTVSTTSTWSSWLGAITPQKPYMDIDSDRRQEETTAKGNNEIQKSLPQTIPNSPRESPDSDSSGPPSPESVVEFAGFAFVQARPSNRASVSGHQPGIVSAAISTVGCEVRQDGLFRTSPANRLLSPPAGASAIR